MVSYILSDKYYIVVSYILSNTSYSTFFSIWQFSFTCFFLQLICFVESLCILLFYILLFESTSIYYVFLHSSKIDLSSVHEMQFHSPWAMCYSSLLFLDQSPSTWSVSCQYVMGSLTSSGMLSLLCLHICTMGSPSGSC